MKKSPSTGGERSKEISNDRRLSHNYRTLIISVADARTRTRTRRGSTRGSFYFSHYTRLRSSSQSGYRNSHAPPASLGCILILSDATATAVVVGTLCSVDIARFERETMLTPPPTSLLLFVMDKYRLTLFLHSVPIYRVLLDKVFIIVIAFPSIGTTIHHMRCSSFSWISKF